MTERIQKSKSQQKREELTKVVEETEPQISEEAEKLKVETDDLLDEIDSLLEENAADFVANYIQKGGE